VRKSDPAVAEAADQFRQDSLKETRKLQQVAALEDAARKRLKHVRQMQDSIKRQAANRKRARKHGLSKIDLEPALVVHPGGAALASAEELTPTRNSGTELIRGDGVPIPMPGLLDASSAGVVEPKGSVEPEGADGPKGVADLGGGDGGAPLVDLSAGAGDPKKDEVIGHKAKKKDKKTDKKEDKKKDEKKHKKKDKKGKAEKESSKEPKTIPSVEVDTESRLRTMLKRFFSDDADKLVIRWLARDIRADLSRARKHMKIKLHCVYLGRPLNPGEGGPGVAEKNLSASVFGPAMLYSALLS
jgi:hypothetical protein